MVHINPESFAAARRASFLSLDEAATICGFKARQTYALREDNPRDLTLGNVVDLYERMNEPGRRLLRDAVAALFSDE